MRRLTILLFLSVFVVSFSFAQGNQEVKKEKSSQSEITFEQTIHDFGNIPYRGNGECEFVFKNTGKEPLVLTNVKTSCGCTTPTWPREPIGKKKEGTIKVKYDTKRQGNFTKTITVFSNASNSPVRLTIKGKVATPSQQELEQLRKEREERAAKNRARYNNTNHSRPQKSVIEKEKSIPEKK